MGFARDGYLNTFPYKVNPGEKATIQIEGDHRSTTLRVNGKVVEEMNIQKCYFNAGFYELYTHIVFPARESRKLQ